MNDKVCIDASLALSWLLPTEKNIIVNELLQDWGRKGIQLISAPIFHAEVTSGIRKQVYFKRLPPEEGEHAFCLYFQMEVETIGEQQVYKHAWELAKRFDLPTTYDMQYLAVAESKDCELWTNDRRFINSLQDKAPRIKWAGDYVPAP